MAHCGACHETFTTVANFDRHRQHSRCVDPASVGLELKRNGRWGMPGAITDADLDQLAGIMAEAGS